VSWGREFEKKFQKLSEADHLGIGASNGLYLLISLSLIFLKVANFVFLNMGV
jgi:hypothetical protein